VAGRAADHELLRVRGAELGIDEVVRRTVERIGDGPVFMSVDVDVLDPAFALSPRPTSRRSLPTGSSARSSQASRCAVVAARRLHEDEGPAPADPSCSVRLMQR